MMTGRLFNDETLERFRRRMPVVDMLNKKYGRDTVRLAGHADPKTTKLYDRRRDEAKQTAAALVDLPF